MIKVLFYLLSFIVLGSAFFVAASRNLVRSIFMFFVTLTGLAGLYVLALADFVAITQVVIYVGGILVLILFAFMLSGRETMAAMQQQQNKLFNLDKLPSLLLAELFFVVIINVIFKMDADHLPWINNAIASKSEIMPTSNMTENIGINLVTLYLLPFEAISVLLLMALVGAAHLSRKESSQ